MRLSAIILICSLPALAAIGDKAPLIPATYVTSHPRLPHPDSTYLNALWATNHTTGAYRRFSDQANSFNPTGTSQWACRYAIIAYMADKLNSGPDHTTWFASVIQPMYQSGATCAGIAYDWVYADLGSGDKTNYLTALDGYSSTAEGNWNGNTSPYNDQAYTRTTSFIWLAAVVQYPDAGATGLKHLRYANDLFLNIIMPAWKDLFAGDCGQSSSADTQCGGGWHEAPEYITSNTGLGGVDHWITVNTLSYAYASGRGTAFFTTDYPWLKNYLYQQPYSVRPDYTMFKYSAMQTSYFVPSYQVNVSNNTAPVPATLGSMEGLVAIYNDADMRAWTRRTVWLGATPDGFEPSSFPFFTPDSSSNTVGAISNLSKVKNFPGWGTLFVKTGWGEEDTSCMIRYGDLLGGSWWSHVRQDFGTYQCYKRGSLEMVSGSYVNNAVPHFLQYTMDTLAHNSILIKDPSDVYTDELYQIVRTSFTITAATNANPTHLTIPTHNIPTGTTITIAGATGSWVTLNSTFTATVIDANTVSVPLNTTSFGSLTGTATYVNNLPIPNTGGERKVGSDISNLGPLSTQTQFPADHAQVARYHEWYQGGRLTNFVIGTGGKYVLASIDITLAYNNVGSGGTHTGPWNPFERNTVNRSPRAQKVVRSLIWIPRGTDGYLVLVDQITSLNSSFAKTIVTHSINTPSLGSYTGGKSYTITRADLVSPTPAGYITYWLNNWCGTVPLSHCATGGTQYQYDGKLYGFALSPTSALTLTNVGGSNNEFNIGGTNYNECGPPSGVNCSTAWFSPSSVAGYVLSDPTVGGIEVGAWRVEQTFNTANTVDLSVNVMLHTTTGGDPVSTNPTVTQSGTSCVEGSNCLSTVAWKDASNACNYSVAFSTSGIGGNIAISGTCVGGTISEGLLSQQAGTALPDNVWTKLPAQSGIGPQLQGWDFTGYVPATDQPVMLLDYKQITSEEQSSLVGYNFHTNTLAVIDSNAKWHDEHFCDNGHPYGVHTIDPVYSLMVGFGNISGSLGDESSSMTCWYDFVGQVGRQKQTATRGVYGATNPQPASAFDALNRVHVYFGGDAGYSTYDPSTNVWNNNQSCTTNSGHPECPQPGTYGQVMAYRDVDHRMYLWDWDGNLYRYDAGSNTPVHLTPTGGPPTTTRLDPIWMYIKSEDKFLLYGGTTVGGGTAYNDTWIYDPVANTWTEVLNGSTNSPPALTGGEPLQREFQRAVYIPGDDVIVRFVPGATIHNIDVWCYRYHAGGNANAGPTPTFTISPGSQNRNSNSWADRPTSAGSGSTIYQGWNETGSDSTSGDGSYPHIYTQKYVGSTQSNLGSAFDSISVTHGESDNPSIAVSGGNPWVSWGQQTGAASLLINAKTFSSGSWGSGGQVGLIGSTPRDQGHVAIADVAGTIHLAIQEWDITTAAALLYVQKWTGSAYAAVGGQINTSGTFVDSVTIASNGSNPCVAWSEFTRSTTDSNPVIRMACWNGSSWVAQGGGIANRVSTNRAYSPSLVFIGSTPFLAFRELKPEGPSYYGVSQLFVETITAGVWALVGSGALNLDNVNGWAFRPELTSDGVSNLYLTWTEQGNSEPWLTSGLWWGSLGQKPQVHVAQWNGSAWSMLGGSLNADTSLGAATHPSISFASSQPAVIQAEVKPGTPRQIYVRQWNGTDWGALGLTCALSPTSLGPYTNGQVVSQTFTPTNCNTSSCSISAGSLTGSGLSLGGAQNCVLSGTAATGTYNFTVAYDVTSNPITLIINAAPSITTSSPLPNGTVGVFYSQTLAASGGTAPLTWTVSSGTVPTGTSLSSGGVLSGTPTTTVGSPFTFTALVTDANSITNSKSFTVTINGGSSPTNASASSGSHATSAGGK